MPGMRRIGMDHDYYAWSPMSSRPRLRWPEDAQVALCVVVNLEHYEWQDPPEPFASVPGGQGQGGRPFPDITMFSRREYGNRVGIYRVMKLLDRYGIRATVAMDAEVASNYPFLVRECQKRQWEFVGHGIAVRRMITSHLNEKAERRYIQSSLETLKRFTGQSPSGWLGPQHGESALTPRLLAEQGIKYVCDWVNDDQPYRMTVPVGKLVSLPINSELDDFPSLWIRRVSVMDYASMVQEAFDTLYEEGAYSGRLLVLSLHPWLIGQPFRSKYLNLILDHICSHKGVWKATGQEIVDWYLRNTTP